MAKEEVNLKKVELKVSVDCCDGCKKKVKKVLRSIEGVFKTEIDPFQPKVTILGNVEPQTLIKKLLKAGKQAEMWSYQNQNAITEKKETEMTLKIDREISKSGCEKAKCSETRATSIEIATNGNGVSDNTDSKKNIGCITTTSSPEVNKNENPLPHHLQVNCGIHPSMLHDTSKEYCYKVEPCTIMLPYYAIHSYKVAPPLAPQSYSQVQYHYESPIFQPPLVQTPATTVGDYFSDENTVGCYVM